MSEVQKVTRHGGVVITIAPVSWPYHEAPYDCWRIYPEGLRALYEDAGLNVALAEWGSIELEPLLGHLPRFMKRRGIWQRLSGTSLLLQEATRILLSRSYDTIVIGRKPLTNGTIESNRR
jgi:hypothetical protein